MSLIIVGVDASEASTRAVEFASMRAHRLGGELLIVHIIPWSPYSFSTPGENERRHQTRQAEIEAATSQIIEPRVKLVADAGVKVDSVVRHGDPVDLLNDLASERGAVQMVLGRTGDTRVKRALFGSIPGHLTRTASVPVTVVP
jgi:nucleotide-binding universal stress UspA family protein